MEKLILSPYQQKWAEDFKAIETALLPALQGKKTYVEHVGSTAVPDLVAKPIIDIDLVFQHATEFGDLKQALRLLGYRHNGDQGIPGREVFKRLAGQMHPVLDGIKHHLYVCQANNRELNRHLLFRDYLRQHAWARAEYTQLKYGLAKEAKMERRRYAELKEVLARDFVERCLAKASEEGKPLSP